MRHWKITIESGCRSRRADTHIYIKSNDTPILYYNDTVPTLEIGAVALEFETSDIQLYSGEEIAGRPLVRYKEIFDLNKVEQP